MNYLPLKLTTLRKHYNLSQSYVAEFLGVDVIEYMGYENGNSVINYNQCKKLASLYHLSFLDLFKNSKDVKLFDINNTTTDDINIAYFNRKNSPKNKIKRFIQNNKIATSIIGILLVAIIILSIILSNMSKPYEIVREDINRLDVSQTTVIYINDSGALGFSGSNTNGQMNDLAITSAIKVCEGEGFSIVLNEDGTIASSGLPDEQAKELSSLKNIIDIAAGNNHVLALDSNGRVICVGEGDACSVDGTKNIKKVFATNYGSILLDNNGSLLYSGSFIGSSSLKKIYNPLDIESSENILAVLTFNKTINVFAKSGSYLKAESWNDIVDVACGDSFVAGLDSFGRVHIEIDNDEIIDAVESWTNIIAIDAGSDFLIGFDGKNIYGVGNNSYEKFKETKKDKITLEQVSDIDCLISKNSIAVQFTGVNNASGYIVSIDVGIGLSTRLDNVDVVTFSNENMIEGKTYTVKIVALGSENYRDSDTAEYKFVYNKPVEVDLEDTQDGE